MFWTLLCIIAIALLVGAVIGWLARGAPDGHKLTDELRDSKRRTSGVLLPKPIPGREQMLRDLRGEPARRDRRWFARFRRDQKARQRRPGSAGNRRRG